MFVEFEHKMFRSLVLVLVAFSAMKICVTFVAANAIQVEDMGYINRKRTDVSKNNDVEIYVMNSNSLLRFSNSLSNARFEVEYNNFGEIKNYNLGHREPGDKVVYDHEDQIASKISHDVRINVPYPEHGGRGACITYIKVEVHQTSCQGSGNIIAGGIHQRFVRFHIDALRTKQFAYHINIYGKDYC